MNLFEIATRRKYRYETERGLVTTEDLWTMPLQSKNGFDLDNVAMRLSNQLEGVKSFVNPTKEDSHTRNRLDIVVHIIESKIADQKASEQQAVNTEKKQRILGILKDKQDDKLKGMSEEDLQKELEKL